MILLFWLGVWQITAVCVDNFLLVVTPLQALRAIIVLAGHVEFWRSALGSLWRIAAGFLLGAVMGLLLELPFLLDWQSQACSADRIRLTPAHTALYISRKKV